VVSTGTSRTITHGVLTVCAAVLFLLAGFIGYQGLMRATDQPPHRQASPADPRPLVASLPPGIALTACSAILSALGVLSLAWSLRYSSPRLESPLPGQEAVDAPSAPDWNDLAHPRNRA
jgi:hypothetical protein